MPNAGLKYLFDRHFAKTCTGAEREELAVIILSGKHEDEIKDYLQQAWESTNNTEDMDRGKSEDIIRSILTSAPIIKQKVAKIHRIWKRVAAAAAIILMVSIGGYFVFKNNIPKEIAKLEPQEKRFKNDIAAPSITKSTITLEDGSIVALDSVSSGTLATQGDVHVVKTADGKVIYDGTSNKLVYNTLTNPRGSKVVDITLSDGSRVWLDAGSSVTYPVAFVGNERKVSITGEAYFEVTHDATKPFVVSKGETTVQVLGTHFNVNAYDDEGAIKVTLLEGSVKVSMVNGQSAMIKPGEQAKVVDGKLSIAKGVDLVETMAWKNGLFTFNEATIETLMKQIEKWYDVDINYEGKATTSHFVVTIPRTVTMSNVFKILEETGGVHFKIEGRKVTVMP